MVEEVLKAEQLEAFLDSLRTSQVLDASDEQYLAAHDLMMALAKRGEWAAHNEWRTLLSPILCSSPTEQAEFYRRFEIWFRREDAPAADAERKSDTARRRFATICAFLAFVLAVPGAYMIWRLIPQASPPPTPPLPPPVIQTGINVPRPSPIRVSVVDSDGVGIDGATLYYLGRTEKSGPGTRIGDAVSPFFIVATHDYYLPALAYANPSQPTIQLVMRPRLGLSELSWRLYLVDHFDTIRRSVVAVPLGVLVSCLAYLLVKRLQLRKWTAVAKQHMRQLEVKGAAHLFSMPEIRKLSLDLRRRRPRESSDLAPDATAEATARHAGLFTPVPAKIQDMPEYVALVERKNLRDHQSRYFDELFTHLRNHDVHIYRYYFQRDPRVCADSKGGIFDISDLAGLRANGGLWLCCDGTNMLDPISGEPEPWVTALEHWNDRTLFSAAPPESGMDSFHAADPSLSGIAAMASTSECGPRAMYPWSLRNHPERWLDREPPTSHEIGRMLAQLHFYLGPPAYLCLSACAVYPTLAWSITLRLADDLIPSAQVEPAIAALARLPWFRYGMMPDWLRYRLVGGLSREQNDKTRRIIKRHLETAVEKGRGEDFIELITERGSSGEGPLHDHVLLSFLWGRKLDPLSVEAPRSWGKLLWGFITVRLFVVLAGAAVLTSVAWFGVPLLRSLVIQEAQRSAVSTPRPASALGARALDIAEVPDQDWEPLVSNTQSSVFVKLCFQIASNVLNVNDPLADDVVNTPAQSGVLIFRSQTKPITPGTIAVGKDSKAWIVQSVSGATLLAPMRGNIIKVPRGSIDRFIDVVTSYEPGPRQRVEIPQITSTLPIFPANVGANVDRPRRIFVAPSFVTTRPIDTNVPLFDMPTSVSSTLVPYDPMQDVLAQGRTGFDLSGRDSNVYPLGKGVSSPSVILKIEPEYTFEAQISRLQGIIVISCIIDEKGNPYDLKVIRPLGMGLDQKAIEAVKLWKFLPGHKDGHPVRVRVDIEIAFRLFG